MGGRLPELRRGTRLDRAARGGHAAALAEEEVTMRPDREGLIIPESCSICSQPLLRAGVAALAVLLYQGPDPLPDLGETNPEPPLRAFHSACVRTLGAVHREAMAGAYVSIPAIVRGPGPRLVAEYSAMTPAPDAEDDDG
jgi:hypothetical protein